MSKIFALALVIIMMLAIAIVKLYLLIKKEQEAKKRYDSLLSASRAQTGELMKEKKLLERREKILKELIIFSHIGFDPTKAEKLKMIENLDADIKAAKDGMNERLGYRCDSAIQASYHFNELGRELIDICTSLQSSLTQSIPGDEKTFGARSLFQELVDYIYYTGIDFCGKHEDPHRRIADVGKVVNFGHLDD